MSQAPSREPDVLGSVDTGALLEQLGDAVIVAGPDMRIRYVNPAVERLLGWPAAELLGAPLATVVPERLRAAHSAGVSRYLSGGPAVLVGGPPVAVPALRADGGEVAIELTLTAARGNGLGEPLLVAALRDVSAREELVLQRQLAGYLQASLSVANLLQTAATLSDALSALLPGLCEQLDWDLARLWRPAAGEARLDCVDLWPASAVATDADLGAGLADEAFRTGQPAVADRAVAFPLVGTTAVRSVVELRADTARRVGPELVTLLAGIGRQLGQFLDRLAAEHETQRTARRYRSLVEAISMDVWRTDASGAFFGDMPRWRAITGQTVAGLQGFGWLSAVHDADAQRVDSAWQRAVRLVETLECEFRIRAAGGGERVVISRGVPQVEGNGLLEWVGITVDVTEQRRAEAAQAALADTLQRSLLPPHLPHMPHVELGSAYRAGGDGLRVGGDFYDVWAVDNSTWDVVIGDVCGKGAIAATVTALARYTMRAAAVHESSPAGVLRLLNDTLQRDERELPFLTAAHLRLRPERGRVLATLAVGGHPLPLVRRASGAIEAVGTRGTLLGVLDDVRLVDAEIELLAGDALVLFTDGIVEARDEAGRQFGEAGIEAVLSAADGVPARSLAARIEAAALAWGGTRSRDDLAVLVLRVRR